MPYICSDISKKLEDETKEKLVKGLAVILKEEAEKPEEYLMIKINDNSELWFGGEKRDIAYIEVKILGRLTLPQKDAITDKITKLYEKETEIPAGNIYITFEQVGAENWGHNGKTFA